MWKANLFRKRDTNIERFRGRIVGTDLGNECRIRRSNIGPADRAFIVPLLHLHQAGKMGRASWGPGGEERIPNTNYANKILLRSWLQRQNRPCRDSCRCHHHCHLCCAPFSLPAIAFGFHSSVGACPPLCFVRRRPVYSPSPIATPGTRSSFSVSRLPFPDSRFC